MTRRVWVGVALAAGMVLGVWADRAGGVSDTGPAVYRQINGTHDAPARVIIRCRAGWAEDTAAHIALVEYGDDRAVWRCQRTGY